MSESPVPQFVALSVVARDFGATMAFYRRLGIDIADDKVWRTDSGPHHIGDLAIGEGTVLQIDSPQMGQVYNSGLDTTSEPRTLLTFTLPTRDAVDALHASLTSAGHPNRLSPWDAFWGARFAIVIDPDGRDIALTSPVDPAMHRAGPDL